MNCAGNLLKEMLAVVSEEGLQKKILRLAQKKYNIKNIRLSTITPPQVSKLLLKNLERSGLSAEEAADGISAFHQTIWGLNQYKLFVWLSVVFAYINQKQLSNFKQEHYSFLQCFFIRKSSFFLEFHIRGVTRDEGNYNPWSEEQTELLVKIIKKYQQLPAWSQISYLLFFHSQKRYYRAPQKCREKWLNHLNPAVNRAKWTPQEDLTLFNLIADHGTKWSFISKKMKGVRTQHMIKNRFNALIRKKQDEGVPIKKTVKMIIRGLRRNIYNGQPLQAQNNEKHKAICQQFGVQISPVNISVLKSDDAKEEGPPSTEKQLSMNHEMMFKESINIESPFARKWTNLQFEYEDEELRVRVEQDLEAF